jgi:adenylate kinase
MPIAAVLLVGHSNAGKTPLGALLEARSAGSDRRLLHLDFGEHLRSIVAGTFDPGLDAEELGFLRSVMQGRLLDDEHFSIARKVVQRFVQDRGCNPGRDVLILNGMPRHLGQALACAAGGIVIRLVVFLDCPPEVALARKRLADAGAGHEDRAHRDDAAVATFERKVRSFDEDTRPLLDHFASEGVPVARVAVLVETTPAQMADRVASDVAAV